MNEQLADTAAIALMLGVAASTVRTWAQRGKLSRRGKDKRGRTLYSLTEADEIFRRGTSTETGTSNA